jgi:hypothetical protein
MDINTYVKQFITTNELSGLTSEEWFTILNQKVKNKFSGTAQRIPTTSQLRKIINKIVA